MVDHALEIIEDQVAVIDIVQQEAIVLELIHEGPRGPAGIQQTFIGFDEPDPPVGYGPFIWYQTDAEGNPLDIRIGTA